MFIESGQLKSRVAFISGASRGIGEAIALRASELGMRLVLCARSAPSIPESDSVIARSLDVRDAESMEALVSEAEERFGTIDLWINNAGVLEPISLMRDMSLDDFKTHLEVNLTGVFIGSQCYVRHLHRRAAVKGTEPAGASGGDAGVLLNMSSAAAWKAFEGWAPYCAAKSGVERLTEVVALEEAALGLRAHSVAPGVVDTEMQALIRSTSADRFPDVDAFREMKETDSFNSARYVANEFLAIAFDPSRRPEEVAVRLESESAPRAER